LVFFICIAIIFDKFVKLRGYNNILKIFINDKYCNI
jgi:hypothetical protein